MNQNLQNILDVIQQNEKLSEDEKIFLLKSLKDTDKELEITAFKLERTEKVKKTTAILLEETIEELEQKRKAVEAQNRELEIETALEKVRSSALAMKEPEDMLEVCQIISDQLNALNVKEIRNVQTAIFYESKSTYFNYEFYSKHNKTFITEVEYKTHELQNLFANQMLNGAEELFTRTFRDKELKDWYEYQKTTNQFADPILETAESLSYYWYSLGPVALGMSTYIPLNEKEINLFKRFRNVFELAYRRFIDIQHAEAQAREAKIEAALERVRSRTMGMQKSEELKEVIKVVYEQFVYLKINVDHAGFVVDYKPKGDWNFWIADEQDIPSKITHPYFESVWANQFNEAKEKGSDVFVTNLNFEEKNKFYNELLSYVPGLPEASKDFYLSCPGLAISTVLLENVGLYIENFSGIAYTDEENNTLMRFGKVFQQTYTRFLDLQKAEAQAREAQIEAALERVRSKTMAMQKSDELAETASQLFVQLNSLGITPYRFNIATVDSESEKCRLWSTTNEGKVIPLGPLIPLNENSVLNQMYDGWKIQQDVQVIQLKGEERISWTKYIMRYVSFNEYKPENIDLERLTNEPAIFSNFFFKQGFVVVHTLKEIIETDLKIIQRFVNVFEQTYTRFLDLQKAETQAREAKIEACLEKVRTVALSLKKSDEMLDIAQVLYEQLIELGFTNIRNAIIDIHNDKNETFLDYDYSHDMGRTVTLMSYYDDPIIEKQVREIESSNDAFFELILEGQDLQDLIDVRLKNGEDEDPRLHQIDQLTYNLYSFGNGAIGISNFGLLSEEQKIVLKRFRNVFAFAYKRYTDMVSAENQAREAKKQASLDRIRAEIASMRTSEDLNRITPIIWRELKNLEVPFIRCGVFIVDEDKENVQVYLTTPDGKSLAALNLTFNANELISNTVDHWRKKQVFKEHWNKKKFINWTKSMIELGQVQNSETYQGSSTPPETLDLHFIPFAQGMLYVGDVSPLSDEKLDLVKTLAEAFSIAYARYEDFKNLEEAKNKVELTLKELKSAQVQLIHSEKMASLGELTAGIAHEIKNPLNFVNNFSEVSRELLDEMIEELKNDNTNEVVALIQNLKQNLEKINQHGKRADSIVKGMLLHSRGTSGEKSLTDINDLLDQYVNLAYHGMRAQNKEFNITIEKEFDETIGKINVIPQDMSRVFLNIINNACFAAYDKKKKNSDNDFSPTLSVSTKSLNGKVEIKIGDNGDGIPKDIIDKIFQPFFTTKPTGEGTGLGLSLSYDIVTKVHGGEIKLNSIEGKYTEFIISLPKFL